MIGAGCRILFGACVVAEGKTLHLGENCIVMENAVIRSTDRHPATIGFHCIVGPHAHLVGCTLEACVFVATGASVFHGAKLGYGWEVRIKGGVHVRTELPAHATVRMAGRAGPRLVRRGTEPGPGPRRWRAVSWSAMATVYAAHPQR